MDGRPKLYDKCPIELLNTGTYLLSSYSYGTRISKSVENSPNKLIIEGTLLIRGNPI